MAGEVLRINICGKIRHYAKPQNGNYNTANGYQSLYSNTIGNQNLANGNFSLYFNTAGDQNTAVGAWALYSNTTGDSNTANGYQVLMSNTTGNFNTALGVGALAFNGAGNNNTAVGANAGPNAANYSNSTALGNAATTTASNQVRLGNASVTSIGGYANWTNLSDERFKKDIKEDVTGLAFIEKLRPVSYELDRQKLNTFLRGEDAAALTDIPPAERSVGFIAQEVEQAVTENKYVFSGVDKPQNERDHYGLRYAEFVVPLTKAVQELSALLKTQQEQNEAQQRLIQSQQERIEALEGLAGGAKTSSHLGGKTSLETESQTLPEGFALYQNTPNPFNTATVIAARVPENVQQAKIGVYNLQGLELASYPLTTRGEVSVEISGARFPAGMYLYALVADGRVMDTKKMLLTQ